MALSRSARGERGDFLHGFAFEREVAKKIRLQRRRNLFVDDLLDGEMRLLVREVAASGEVGD